MKENPCHKCIERNPDCHAQCDKYLTWKKEWDKQQERTRQTKEQANLGWSDHLQKRQI